jgi:hypothetical protein
MTGKYDPPNKARLLKVNPHIDSTVELMVASAEAQFPPKVKSGESASHAIAPENVATTVKRGRKGVVTAERVQLICEALARGESETSGCLKAGIGLTAWNVAKRCNAELRARIVAAREEWARLKHKQHTAALYESQWARSASRKAQRPQPTYQAKLVMWHLITRVPLNFGAIPEPEIARACEKFNLPLETWRRQERAFALMRKVYGKRAAIRGQQQPT